MAKHLTGFPAYLNPASRQNALYVPAPDSLKLSCLVWVFWIYALPYPLLLLIGAADISCCITYASRQAPTSYRLLPTYYNGLLFSMCKVPAKSRVQKPCSIQMDFTKYCTVMNTCRQNVSPIAYMTQPLSHKGTQPAHFSYYAESQLSQE